VANWTRSASCCVEADRSVSIASNARGVVGLDLKGLHARAGLTAIAAAAPT
jgi:hypothetical protein